MKARARPVQTSRPVARFARGEFAKSVVDAAIDPSRVVVAHSGPSLSVGRHAHPGRATRRPDVGLVVSTLEPRKNPEFTCRWFHESPALPDRAELWWVGSIGWLTSRRDLRQFTRAYSWDNVAATLLEARSGASATATAASEAT